MPVRNHLSAGLIAISAWHGLPPSFPALVAGGVARCFPAFHPVCFICILIFRNGCWIRAFAEPFQMLRRVSSQFYPWFVVFSIFSFLLEGPCSEACRLWLLWALCRFSLGCTPHEFREKYCFLNLSILLILPRSGSAAIVEWSAVCLIVVYIKCY